MHSKSSIRLSFEKKLHHCFSDETNIKLKNNFVILSDFHEAENQDQTNSVFSEKWSKYDDSPEQENLYEFQREWYLKLYGFQSEENLIKYLKNKQVIFDAGCGLGYKAAWFAKLAPNALVIGMDYSEAAELAAKRYSDINNLFFIRGDIANTSFLDGVVNYTSCDQVIMHTENPELTFKELVRITNEKMGEVACYFYAKKALPRELLDDFFRLRCKDLSSEQLWEMSEQLTELGKRLSQLNVSFDCPDIPLLDIKGGNYDIQRFIYWNFLKCFWSERLGLETSISTNFDWYSPANAKRFSRNEVEKLISDCGMDATFIHSEEAAHSGRFVFKI